MFKAATGKSILKELLNKTDIYFNIIHNGLNK